MENLTLILLILILVGVAVAVYFLLKKVFCLFLMLSFLWYIFEKNCFHRLEYNPELADLIPAAGPKGAVAFDLICPLRGEPPNPKGVIELFINELFDVSSREFES